MQRRSFLKLPGLTPLKPTVDRVSQQSIVDYRTKDFMPLFSLTLLNLFFASQ